ncbi:MAG: hypothetical protein B7X12_09855, partial [Halothiobacillus sp. 20-53-49]
MPPIETSNCATPCAKAYKHPIVIDPIAAILPSKGIRPTRLNAFNVDALIDAPLLFLTLRLLTRLGCEPLDQGIDGDYAQILAFAGAQRNADGFHFAIT